MQLRLGVQYDGSGFEGWQLQPSGATIQGELERALTTALREPVRVRGAGRTDAGVERGRIGRVDRRFIPHREAAVAHRPNR